MKKTLAVMLCVAAGVLLCGSAFALDAYIPHITAGANDWTDYLQVNNNASSTANFTLYLYDGDGAQIYSQSHAVGGRSRYQVSLKALDSDAATGKITYTEPGLVFRVSYESEAGGVAEFRAIDALGSNIGFCYSDFTSLVQWKGAAIANMGTTNATVNLYALGGSAQGTGGSILETHAETIPPKTKALVSNLISSWLEDLELGDIESIVAVTGSSSLCGIAISGDMTSSRLLFTPAALVSSFNPQAVTWNINASVNIGGVFPVTADFALTISGATYSAVLTTKLISGSPEVYTTTLTGPYDSTTGVGTVTAHTFGITTDSGPETVILNGTFQITGNSLTATGTVGGTNTGTFTATGTK